MKKFLLSIAAAALAITASAEIVDYEGSFEGDKFPFYVMGYEPTIENGILKAEYPGSWYQFFIADQIPTTVGETYTATVKIKASQAGTLALNMGWGWGDGEQIGSSINVTTDWTEATTTYEGVGGTKCNLVLQPGTHEGTIEIEWVKVSHGGEPVEIPTTGNVVAEFFTANSDQTFGGWGATFENVEEDGKPCLKMTNTEAKDPWAVQMAINYPFEAGTTYYIGFDIKGDAAKGIEVNYQANGEEDGKAYYESKGSLTKASVTPEWNHVIVYGECTEGSNAAHPATCVLFNLGKYVGTFYMTNVTVYTADNSGVEALPVAEAPARRGVYNLQGVRVLDNAGQLSTLAPGIYIVNGKKTVIMNR